MKWIRNEPAAYVDDNDFEVAPYRARTKHAAPASDADFFSTCGKSRDVLHVGNPEMYY